MIIEALSSVLSFALALICIGVVLKNIDDWFMK
jgi:hypothetical protein